METGDYHRSIRGWFEDEARALLQDVKDGHLWSVPSAYPQTENRRTGHTVLGIDRVRDKDLIWRRPDASAPSQWRLTEEGEAHLVQAARSLPS